MAKETLNDRIYVRISTDDKHSFVSKCKDVGMDQNDIHRELLIAYSEDRISIKPTDETLKTLKHKQDLYNDDRK